MASSKLVNAQDMHAAKVRPEHAIEDVCCVCAAPVWRVPAEAGAAMTLDASPQESGTVEMVRLGSRWQAEVLHQVEQLFAVERPRWVPHSRTCPGVTVPSPRRAGAGG